MSTMTDTTSGETKTIWFDTATVPHYTPLGKKTIQADVCVVGGGFGGLSAAYALAQEGKKVVLLEGREISSGESGRTSAHLMSAMDDRFYQLKKYHGEKGARLAAESHIAAIDIIEQNIKRENIECDFARVEGYLIAKDQSDSSLRELDEEVEAAVKAGHTGARIVTKSEIGTNTGKAILFPNQGELHPIKYLAGLAHAIEKKGGQIFTQTKMTEFEGGDAAKVKTADGGVVECKDIVLAMNNSVNSVELMVKEEPYRTYMIAGTVPKGSVKRALLWDTADPYRYVRIYPKDNTEDWLLSGGEDHKVGGNNDYERPYKNLEEWTRKHFPQLSANLTYKWSGQVWEPADSLAYIGRHAHDKKNVYVITGDSGTGLTHTTIGGKLITDLIMGRENEWAQIYEPTRKPPLSAAGTFARAAFEMSSGYLRWLKLGDIKDIEDLKPNTGGVLLKGTSHIACYKDEAGKVTQCSAVCTHLNGIVKWNDGEKSWDCPCHGSRFDKFGKCIQGPAIKDLPPA